eukprot:m.356396 g.356396  ORF g.356396 m.356396 type:complete len:199 (+) comp17534_c0_seq1:168-764(+)
MSLTAVQFAATLVVVGVLGAHACGRWVKSTPRSPVPDNAFQANWNNKTQPIPPSFHCACGNMTGNLMNSDDGFGPGYKCWYQSSSNTFCGVGEYTVLVSDFPSYNGPTVTDSTYTKPVPKDAIPGPGAQKSGYENYACVQYVDFMGVRGVYGGSLRVSPKTGGYVCQTIYTSNTQYTTTIDSSVAGGQYAVVTGSKCL